jgi:hypothetical protein
MPALVQERNDAGYWMDPARGAFLVVDGFGCQAAFLTYRLPPGMLLWTVLRIRGSSDG